MLTEGILPEGLRKAMEERSGESQASHLTPAEFARLRADAYNSDVGSLEGDDCPLCLNRGDVMKWKEDGSNYVVECECMARRRAALMIRKSGLGDLIERYTLEKWQTVNPWQKKLKDSVESFADHPNGWFYVAGRPGTGKTHLCTSLCSLLMRKNIEVRYLVWRDFSVKAKAMVKDAEEYEDLLRPYRRAAVLYVDDLFKSGRGIKPTEGDINLAFELINDRYNDQRLITVISSELNADDLLTIDEGLGSRIYERSKGHYFDLTDCENWRLTH